MPLTSLYPDLNAWQKEYELVASLLPPLERHRGKLGLSPVRLCEFLSDRDRVAERVERVWRYALLRYWMDLRDQEALQRMGEARELKEQFQRATRECDAELAELSPEVLAAFRRGYAPLARYAQVLDELAHRNAHRPAGTQQALAALQQSLAAPESIYHHAFYRDMVFDPVANRTGDSVAIESIGTYFDRMFSPDAELRRQTHRSVHRTLRRYQATAAACIQASMATRADMARLHGYETVLESVLGPSGIPTAIYDQILTGLRQELAPLVQRFTRIQACLLGLDSMGKYDLLAPVVQDGPAFSFAEGAALVRDGLSQLGPQYAAMMDQAFGERWIDWARTAGKTRKALCSPIYGYHPVILLAWQGTFRDVCSLGHELGHAVHYHLAMQHQAYATSGSGRFSKFFLEIPSMLSELQAGFWTIGQQQDPQRRTQSIVLFLSNLLHTMARDLVNADLERRLYDEVEAGEQVTADRLCDLYGEAFRGVYGHAVLLQEEDLLGWMLVGSLFKGYQSYAYLIGFAGAAQLLRRLGEDREGASHDLVAALEAGSSLDPLKLAKRAGIDFGLTGVQDFTKPLRTLLAELEESVGEEH